MDEQGALEVDRPVAAARPPARATGTVAATTVAAALLTTATALTVATTFAPWLRTGSARRTSYQVVQAADRLEVLSSGPQTVVSVVWAFLPLVAALGLLAVTVGRLRLAALLGAVVGAAVVALAVLVKTAPRAADWGATAGLASGSTLVVAAAATTWITRRRP